MGRVDVKKSSPKARPRKPSKSDDARERLRRNLEEVASEVVPGSDASMLARRRAAKHVLVDAHDALGALLSAGGDSGEIEDTQAILRALAMAFTDDGDTSARAREARGEALATLRKRLVTPVRSAEGELFNFPLKVGLDPMAKTTPGGVAELVAASLETLRASGGETEDAEACGALAVYLIHCLWRLYDSRISRHINARWEASSVQDADEHRLQKLLLKELHDAADGKVAPERAVVLALRAVDYPKPNNVFSKRDKRASRGTGG